MFGARMQDRSERTISSLPWGDWGDDGPANTSAGARVTTRSAAQLLAVYGCNAFICDGISTLPVDVLRAGSAGPEPVKSPPSWLAKPTADLEFIPWCGQMLTSLLLDGNAVARVVRNAERDQIVEVVPLDPSTVSVVRVGGRKRVYVAGKESAEEILHIPGIMFPGSDWGLSPVEAARQTIGKGMAVEEFAGKFFSNGATMSGVIEDPAAPDPVKAKETARIFSRRHGGNRNAHTVGVLMGGAKWQTTGVTNEQAQFLETHQFTTAQIAAFMFRIDPTEFGVSFDKGSSVTYANLEQRNARKVQVTYLPWIVRLEKAISSLLPRPQYMKFNVSGLLRGDTKTRFETYEIAARINTAAAGIGMAPVMDTAEMRGFEDWGPYDGPAVSAPVAAAEPAASADTEDKSESDDEAKALPYAGAELAEIIYGRSGRPVGVRKVAAGGAA